MTEAKVSMYDDMIDVLNPFNGKLVGKVVNSNKKQVHDQLNEALKYKCKLSAKWK